MESRPECNLFRPIEVSTLEEDKAKIEAYRKTAPSRAEVLAERQQKLKRIKRLRVYLNLPVISTDNSYPGLK